MPDARKGWSQALPSQRSNTSKTRSGGISDKDQESQEDKGQGKQVHEENIFNAPERSSILTQIETYADRASAINLDSRAPPVNNTANFNTKTT